MRGSWRLNKDCNILTSLAPPDIAVCRSRSPGLLDRGPGGPASLGHVLIPASSHQLVSKCPFCQVVAFPTTSDLQLHPRAPSAGWWLSLPHLVSNFSGPQLTSYIIVQSPTQSLEWHVWSSSSRNNCHAVHRSLSSGASVYECTMGFLPCPIFSAKPAYAISSHNCHWNVSLPSGASLWNGMFGWVKGQYTTYIYIYIYIYTHMCVCRGVSSQCNG